MIASISTTDLVAASPFLLLGARGDALSLPFPNRSPLVSSIVVHCLAPLSYGPAPAVEGEAGEAGAEEEDGGGLGNSRCLNTPQHCRSTRTFEVGAQ